MKKSEDLITYDQIYCGQSKPIIDEIDRGPLASHYGFTEAELDLAMNFDLKFRNGPNGEDG